MDDTGIERAESPDGADWSAGPLGPPTPPPARRSPTRRLVLAAATIGLITVVFLSIVRCSANGAAPPLAAPTATQIAPIVAEQMTATADVEAWTALQQRPLHLRSIAPGSPCPLTPARQLAFAPYGPALGDGPVYPTGFNPNGTLNSVDAGHFLGGRTAWGGGKVVWAPAPGFKGPAVVRGHQIDGPHEVRFNGGFDQRYYQGDWADAPLLSVLRLTEVIAGGSYIRLQALGCYALQVDGLSFSEVIVFQAVTAP